jgi:hypothetical protein
LDKVIAINFFIELKSSEMRVKEYINKAYLKMNKEGRNIQACENNRIDRLH